MNSRALWTKVTVHVDIESEVEGAGLLTGLVVVTSGWGSRRRFLQDGNEHRRVHGQVEHLVVRDHHRVAHWLCVEALLEHHRSVGRGRG